jgi:signal transduction histidine kinase
MATEDRKGFEKIGFKMHPRVFAALGADLVTNDVVAVIELVKNSYDAFATNVWIRFQTDPEEGEYIEIEDDGQGMSKEIIENVWCVVATPYREENPYAMCGRRQRRVAGEKGLGRLSVARLGDRLHMLTQAPGEPCWEVEVNWSDVAVGNDLSSCFASCRRNSGRSPFKTSGTRLRIFGLKVKWDEGKISDLEDNLARLISPFGAFGAFDIFLLREKSSGAEPVRIQSPEFLNKPKYLITGKSDSSGEITATYKFAPILDGKARTKHVSLLWEQAYDSMSERWRFQGIEKFPFAKEGPQCGGFSFEIRAWDIDTDGTKEIQERFDFQKSKVRKAIRAHKGISVYRDGILILPKSETARDWLGLDLRRVSKVGERLSTSEIVGYVTISAAENPAIQDTSDRERLVGNRAVAEFEELLITVVQLLENERDGDRIKKQRPEPLPELFARLSADDIVSEIEDIVESDAPAGDVLPAVRKFNEELKTAAKDIQHRFTFYSQLATVGTIAQILVHEIRNRTTSLGHLVRIVQDKFAPFEDLEVAEAVQWADEAIHSLESLADTFAPLASRSFRRRVRDSVLEERIRTCLNLLQGEIKKKDVECSVPKGATRVAIDPGELDAVILNLVTNSLYWLGNVQDKQRRLQFQLEKADHGARVRVWVHDNGPGVTEEDAQKVFEPGFTRKPGGIGMGLTVASELVREYDGRMRVTSGRLGGASFGFDVPVKKG